MEYIINKDDDIYYELHRIPRRLLRLYLVLDFSVYRFANHYYLYNEYIICRETDCDSNLDYIN
jgi:hypothetical protein